MTSIQILSPEERAKTARELYRKVDEAIISGEAISLIYNALKDAEDAAYERAAAIALNPGFIEATDTDWDGGVNFAKRFIHKAIRDLKSQEPA